MTITAQFADAAETVLIVDYGDGRTATVPVGSDVHKYLISGYEFPAVVPDPYALSIDDLKSYAENVRRAKEDAGVPWGDTFITSDDRANILLLADSLGVADTSTVVVGGVAYTGVTGAQFAVIVDAISAHVQLTFATMAAVLAEIEAETITTTAEIDTAFA